MSAIDPTRIHQYRKIASPPRLGSRCRPLGTFPRAAINFNPSSRRRTLWQRFRIVRLFVAAYLLVVLAMVFFENSLIFFPSVYPEGNWNPRDLEFEDAWFEAADGTRLHGWYCRAQDPRAVVLLAHGNGGNLSDRADIVRVLVDRLGASVMIFDYRGYGRSAGSPSQAGVLADARAARRWLARALASTSRKSC